MKVAALGKQLFVLSSLVILYQEGSALRFPWWRKEKRSARLSESRKGCSEGVCTKKEDCHGRVTTDEDCGGEREEQWVCCIEDHPKQQTKLDDWHAVNQSRASPLRRYHGQRLLWGRWSQPGGHNHRRPHPGAAYPHGNNGYHRNNQRGALHGARHGHGHGHHDHGYGHEHDHSHDHHHGHDHHHDHDHDHHHDHHHDHDHHHGYDYDHGHHHGHDHGHDSAHSREGHGHPVHRPTYSMSSDYTDMGPQPDLEEYDDSTSSEVDCEVGTCMRRRECRGRDFVGHPPTGNCGRGYEGRWVCCAKKSNPPTTAKPPATTTTATRRQQNDGGRWRRVTTLRPTTTRPGKNDGCMVGRCQQRSQCHEERFAALPPTGLCKQRRNGPWVCCHEQERRGRPPNAEDIIPGSSAEGPLSYVGCGLREGYVEPKMGRSYNIHPDAEFINSNSSNSPNGNRSASVVGGREVDPYSWPWIAALFKQTTPGINRFVGAGTLISARYVITAAHVFTVQDVSTAASTIIVSLGTHTGSDSIGEYRVKSIRWHPWYESQFYYNDIALLELEFPVLFNRYVYPVCLPRNNALRQDSDLVGKNVTVVGWGDDAFGGKSSDVLKEATFPVVSRRTCNASYIRVAQSKFPRGITDKMLCAGSPRGGKDACQGDSGGPLTLKKRQNWVLVGIVSFGYSCGDSQYPGVYTKVGMFVDWIMKVIVNPR